MKKTIFTMLTLAFIGLSTTYGQVGVGTNSPDASAALEVSSTTKGFLPPRIANANRPNNPAEGLTIYNTTINCLEVFNGTGWQSLCDGNLSAPLISSGACAGEPAFFDFNGLEYKPVESSGECWLDRNLGASSTAVSSTDFDAYGSLYQWGRQGDGHELVTWTSGTTGTPVNTTTIPGPVSSPSPGVGFVTFDGNWYNGTTPDPNDLWKQDGTGINNPCPAGYRIPTQAEMHAEFTSWGSNNNATGAMTSPLKLPMVGYLNRTSGAPLQTGVHGRYWSSTISGADARYLQFRNLNDAGMSTFFRGHACSVRCLKN